jgi:hypothetical protein
MARERISKQSGLGSKIALIGTTLFAGAVLLGGCTASEKYAVGRAYQIGSRTSPVMKPGERAGARLIGDALVEESRRQHERDLAATPRDVHVHHHGVGAGGVQSQEVYKDGDYYHVGNTRWEYQGNGIWIDDVGAGGTTNEIQQYSDHSGVPIIGIRKGKEVIVYQP